jgi:hypothetical protein
MAKSKKKLPQLPLIELDHLCLAALSDLFRCDRDANHPGNCNHSHEDELLCQ